ncbi:MAG: YceI family protein [Chitinophagaceae bacterium]
MKKITLFAAAIVFTTFAMAQTWSIDKAHSRVGYNVLHMGISQSDGNFKIFDAKITSSKDDFSDATVNFTADVNSINTDNERRDGHLKSADFFDAAKYPAIEFKSKTFKKVGDKKYKVAGDLTFHGVTKPVELDATLVGVVTNPQSKKQSAGFTITGIIKRADFNFAAGMPATALGENVELIAHTEFSKD